ncbi:MAG TPA: SRPBCC family protein [Mycobacteriales bacterium]|nr:SRPBCC family protein [Mycobacteriales bacterium]
MSINRSPAEVFAYLSDVSKHAEWSPKPYRVEGTSGPVKVGDTFASVGTIPGDKNHRNQVTVTECSAPTRLVLDAEEKGQHFINTFDLQPQGDSTLVTRTMDAPKPSFPLSVVFPLILAAVIRPDVHKGLNNLKAILERG